MVFDEFEVEKVIGKRFRNGKVSDKKPHGVRTFDFAESFAIQVEHVNFFFKGPIRIEMAWLSR